MGISGLPSMEQVELRLRPFSGEREEGTPEQVLFSPDGKWLVLTSQAGEIAVYAVETLRPAWRIHTDKMFPYTHIIDNSQVVACWTQAGSARAWDLVTGEEQPPPFQYPWRMISPQGTWTVDYGMDDALELYGSLGRLLKESPDALVAMSDTHLCLAAENESEVRVFALEGEELLQVLSLEVEQVDGMALSPCSRYLAVVSDDALSILSIAGGNPLCEGKLPPYMAALGWSPDGRQFVVCVEHYGEEEEGGSLIEFYACDPDSIPDLSAPVWRFLPYQSPSTWLEEERDDHPNSFCFSKDSRYFALQGQSGHVLCVELETRELQWHRMPATDAYLPIHSGPEGDVVLCGKEAWEFATGAPAPAQPTAYHMSPSGTWRVEVDALNGRMQLEPGFARIEQPETVEAAAISTDEKQALVGGIYDHVSLWQLQDLQELRRYALWANEEAPDNERARHLSFAPDGVHFSVATFHQIELRRLDTGEAVETLRSDDFIDGPHWSHDGQWMAIVHVGGAMGYGGYFTLHRAKPSQR